MQRSVIITQDNPKEDVNSFTYQEIFTSTSTSGGTEEDIRSRIGKARYVFTALRHNWNNKNIRLPTKLKLFTSNWLNLLYKSEAWRHTKAHVCDRSFKSAGQRQSPRKTCGKEQPKSLLQKPLKRENGDGLDTPWARHWKLLSANPLIGTRKAREDEGNLPNVERNSGQGTQEHLFIMGRSKRKGPGPAKMA